MRAREKGRSERAPKRVQKVRGCGNYSGSCGGTLGDEELKKSIFSPGGIDTVRNILGFRRRFLSREVFIEVQGLE